MCMIRLQRHMGAVALMGPGSGAEWDWLPTELGCCCPESESDTHNVHVSASPSHLSARAPERRLPARAIAQTRGPSGKRRGGGEAAVGKG